jgi:hypothetical protein
VTGKTCHTNLFSGLQHFTDEKVVFFHPWTGLFRRSKKSIQFVTFKVIKEITGLKTGYTQFYE